MARGRLLLVDTPDGLRRRAFGGDIVQMRMKQSFPYDLLDQIKKLPFMTGMASQVGPREMQLIVDEANTAIPRLLDWTREKNLEIESIGENLPPFDDVFVKLVKEEEKQVVGEGSEHA
jgi:ABC-2 type transport system ATP-binding protein